jgi:hypothetical protein
MTLRNALILRKPRSGCLEGRMATIRLSRILSRAQMCQPRAIVILASRCHALPTRQLQNRVAGGSFRSRYSRRGDLSLAKAISTNHLQVG